MMSCAGSANNFNKKKGKEMPRNKQQARRHKQQASSNKQLKSPCRTQTSSKQMETLIKILHDAWAYENGYKAQAPRHKLRQNVARYNASDYKDSSSKPQAS